MISESVRAVMAALVEHGRCEIRLDSLDSVPRFFLDTDEEFDARRVARARQRLYFAGFYVWRNDHTFPKVRTRVVRENGRVVAVVGTV